MLNNLFSPTSINQYIKDKVTSDFVLKGLQIKGELSNYKKHPTGHIYFSLKDSNSYIKGVMFKSYTNYVDNDIKDGDEVIVSGYIDVYVARGEYQIYAQAIQKFGKGAQLLELEKIKKKLQAEGLFDESRKRKINIFPKSIAVISGKNSAAMADIETNLLRRYPIVEIIKIPTQVQGEGASQDLIRAFNLALTYKPTTIIIGRGGGSNEDLYAFNDESLARLIASSPIPTISAVGHEIDFTLVDYVSDKRASTPTGAAELATIDKRELEKLFADYPKSMYDNLSGRIKYLSNKLELLKNRSFFNNPGSIYEAKINQLQQTKLQLHNSLLRIFDKKNSQFEALKSKLQGINPYKVLQRGFALISDENGNIIKSVDEIKVGNNIKTQFKDGSITSKVINKDKKE